MAATSFLWTRDAIGWTIAEYVTPELAELLVSVRNNLPDLVRWALAGLTARDGDG